MVLDEIIVGAYRFTILFASLRCPMPDRYQVTGEVSTTINPSSSRRSPLTTIHARDLRG